jgi:ribosomal protein L11 methyltransferase
MSRSWKITALAPREIVESALVAHEDALDWDPEMVLSGSEIAEDRPDDWRLEVWLPREPSDADRAVVAALFADDVPDFAVEELPATDWVTQSQQGLEPIRAGRFHVHTPEHPALDEPGIRDFVIPASRAFGTGQHATTAGCLAMLTHMKRQGLVVRNLADIGTGTGLLAFAARGPYDLVIANILAGPLIALAPDFAQALVPGGHLLLAGLLETQEDQVRTACRRAGLRLAARLVNGDWSILWLRKRAGVRTRASRPGALPEWAKRW